MLPKVLLLVVSTVAASHAIQQEHVYSGLTNQTLNADPENTMFLEAAAELSAQANAGYNPQMMQQAQMQQAQMMMMQQNPQMMQQMQQQQAQMMTPEMMQNQQQMYGAYMQNMQQQQQMQQNPMYAQQYAAMNQMQNANMMQMSQQTTQGQTASKVEEKAEVSCHTTMSAQDVSGCWDLAVQIGMQGEDHETIINQRNGVKCQDSNPQPGDIMAYPCDQPEGQRDGQPVAKQIQQEGPSVGFVQTAESYDFPGVTNQQDMGFSVQQGAYQAQSIQQQPLPNMGQDPAAMVDSSETLYASTGLYNQNLDGCPIVTSMKEHDCASCWDLAVKLGMDGSDHKMIKNRKNGKECANSMPQPSDTMEVPCPEQLEQAKLFEESEELALAQLALKGGLQRRTSRCKTTMAEQSVTDCWSLAVKLGFDATDNEQLFNVAKGQTCSTSNPSITDSITYPCTDVDAASSGGHVYKTSTIAQSNSLWSHKKNEWQCSSCVKGHGPCFDTRNGHCKHKRHDGSCPSGHLECGYCMDCFQTSAGSCQNTDSMICFGKTAGTCPSGTMECPEPSKEMYSF